MRSDALLATLFVAAALVSSCAGVVQSLQKHNDSLEARQEARRVAYENQRASSAGLEDTPAQQPTTEPHAPYTGKVKVALFLTFRGELWQKGMRNRAADMFREDLAAHAQFEVIPKARMQQLGSLEQPEMDSAAWVSQVRGKFGKNGPQVLLHVTLTSEESIGRNTTTGKVEKYPKFTAQTSYRHVQRNAAAEFTESGHVFKNGNVTNAVIEEFHERTLTEIMPAN